MATSNTLTAYPRDIIGKANRRLSQENRIPAVLYGPSRASAPLSVDRHDFELFLAHHASGSTVVELEVEGEKKPINVMIRELQTSPIKGNVVHVDFLAVEMNKLIHSTTALHFINDPAGVKVGGIFNANLHEVNIEATPADLPESIMVDCAALEIGDSLHVSDVVPPAGVRILDDPDEVVVSIQAPRLEVEEEVAVEETQPEVIGSKAEEE